MIYDTPRAVDMQYPKSFGELCIEVATEHLQKVMMRYGLNTNCRWEGSTRDEVDALRRATYHKERGAAGDTWRDFDNYIWEPTFGQAAEFLRIVGKSEFQTRSDSHSAFARLKPPGAWKSRLHRNWRCRQ